MNLAEADSPDSHKSRRSSLPVTTPQHTQLQPDKFVQSKKFNSSGPFLGFEDVTLAIRSYATLDLDVRFFPNGISSGQIVEVKGHGENIGKTFLLTYFMIQLLVKYPFKKVLLIDTAHQFHIGNLKILLSKLSGATELTSFLERVIVIKCYTVEEFMTTLACKKCVLERLMNKQPELSLVVIDSVDAYSFSNSLNENASFNILSEFRKNCPSIPVICSTLGGSRGGKSNKEVSTDGSPSPSSSKHFENIPRYICNVVIDNTLFTHTLTIEPSSEREKEKEAVQLPAEFKNGYLATAYLRSKHRASIAAGSAIHRVKFSIFSDMLWFVP